MASLEQLFSRGAFPRSAQFMDRLAQAARKEFEEELFTGAPAWWGRMALSTEPGGGGGILVRDVPGGKDVEYADQGYYNYVQVIQEGRPRYSTRDALMRSPRARRTEDGVRYHVVPLTRNDSGQRIGPRTGPVNAVLKKSGYESDDGGQMRSSYRIFQRADGEGDVFAMAQHVKGGIQRSYVRFVLVTEYSKGWYYPAIPANPIEKNLQAKVDRALRSDTFRKRVRNDVEDFLQRAL